MRRGDRARIRRVALDERGVCRVCMRGPEFSTPSADEEEIDADEAVCVMAGAFRTFARALSREDVGVTESTIAEAVEASAMVVRADAVRQGRGAAEAPEA